MTNEMVKNFLTYKINNWYENAEIDYNVKGCVEKIEYTDKTVAIKVVEDGIKYSWVFDHYSDYTHEQIYNIWMEGDWEEIA